MKFEVQIIGCGSATPSLSRNPAAQVINVRENYLLLDCGEGTQLQMRRFGVKFQRIDHVFISHLHGDHYLGLVGYIQTMHLLGRKKELHIYGPPALEEIIRLHNKLSETYLSYPLRFHPLQYEKEEVILETEVLEVISFPLRHRIPCSGFRINEKQKKLPLNPAKLKQYKIPVFALPSIKEGADFITEEGMKIPNEELVLERPPSFSYAYCSDTAFDERIVPFIKGCNAIYHESTFTDELEKRAKETYHSTARQAGRIAARAEVGQLILGHFSVRYRDLNNFLDQAREEFQNTIAAEDGMSFNLYDGSVSFAGKNHS